MMLPIGVDTKISALYGTPNFIRLIPTPPHPNVYNTPHTSYLKYLWKFTFSL